MRPRLTCITAVALFATSWSLASGQELEWIHTSQQKSRSAAKSAPATASKQPGTRKVEVRHLEAKQPTFRQPQQFKQPQRVKVVELAPQAAAPTTNTRPTYRQASNGHRQPRPQRTNSQVVPTQYEEIPAPDEAPTFEPYDSVYAGEADCGFPEPTCGCAGPCGCGSGGYLGEPGCGLEPGCGCGPGCGCEPSCGASYGPWGHEMVIGEPGCGVGCGCGCGGECGPGGCGCGDACCGDVCCEPTCGCGGAGCNECRNWPHALFGCDERGCVPILWVPPPKELTIFGGVHGFKNPLDGNRDGGNFGFHEGFNIGGRMAWLPWPGLGYQFGYQAVHSQLSGDGNTMTDDAHTQHFLTTGLFRRKRLGLQYGVVWDMLRDERQESADYGQVRGEIGYKNCLGRELGFAWMANSNSNVVGNEVTYAAVDQYLAYYRITGCKGGECRMFAGFSGRSDAILGSDFHTPLTNSLSLEGNWAYLIPDGGNAGSAAREEAWNISMQLVWHFGCRAKSWHNRPYRPMFNVADNGSLIVVD